MEVEVDILEREVVCRIAIRTSMHQYESLLDAKG